MIKESTKMSKIRYNASQLVLTKILSQKEKIKNLKKKMGRGQRGGDYEKGKKKRALSAEVFLFFLIYIGKTNDNKFFIKRL